MHHALAPRNMLGEALPSGIEVKWPAHLREALDVALVS